jgi:hypothetical protein
MATSGFPLFIDSIPAFLVYFAYCILCTVFCGINLKPYFLPLVIFSLVLLLQFLNFGWYYMPTLGAQVMIFITAIITVDILGERFLPTFVKIMSIFSVISLVIFIPILLKPSLLDLILSNSPIHFEVENVSYGERQTLHSLLVMNFTPDFVGRMRNAGPFWEAGVYGGFLTIALMVNTMLQQSIFTRRGLLFVVTILSTFSTTAYLGLFLFFSIYYAIKIGSPLLRVAIVVVFGLSITIAYSSFDFLGNKIETEIDQMVYDAQVQGGNSRMASAYLDITELVEKPFYIFLGRGSHPENRVATTDKDVQRNNGTTDLLALWGLPFYIFYFFCLWTSMKAFCSYAGEWRSIAAVFVFVLLVLAFSEPYFRFGFFWALIILFVPYLKAAKKLRTPHAYQAG